MSIGRNFSFCTCFVFALHLPGERIITLPAEVSRKNVEIMATSPGLVLQILAKNSVW